MSVCRAYSRKKKKTKNIGFIPSCISSPTHLQKTKTHFRADSMKKNKTKRKHMYLVVAPLYHSIAVAPLCSFFLVSVDNPKLKTVFF